MRLFVPILLLLMASTLHARRQLKPGQVAHTQVTLNYKIITTYSMDMSDVSTLYLDVHSGKEIKNPEMIEPGTTVEERYEDLENLVVIKYSLDGNFLSQRAFKKTGELVGEIILSDDEIRAMEQYDVEDEDLKIQTIDWDRVIFADENFSKEFITRWSDLRDFKVKTEYTRDGLIHRRTAWNKYTGQKVLTNHKIYAQTIKKDLVQNHRGFIEIYYNTIGKVTAIRSWDRKTGRVIRPPRRMPFSFRLERDFLQMDYEENKEFREDYFREYVDGKPLEVKEGESLFKEEIKEYRFLKSLSFGGFFSKNVEGRVGQTRSANYTNTDPDAFLVSSKFQPGKYPVYGRYIHLSYKARTNQSFQVKNTLFPTGADLQAKITTLDHFGKKALFQRTDSQVDLLGGIRSTRHQLSFVDGSRNSFYDDWTFQPVVGVEGSWWPFSRSRLSAQLLLMKFHVGGVDSSGYSGKVEYSYTLPASLSRLVKGMEINAGYQKHNFELRTDTDTLNEVGFDSDFGGSYLEFKARF